MYIFLVNFISASTITDKQKYFYYSYTYFIPPAVGDFGLSPAASLNNGEWMFVGGRWDRIIRDSV